MKLNWGGGIATVYILFMIGVLIMVYIFMSQDVALETENYYAKGIDYQKQIEKIERANKLAEQPLIEQTSDNIILSFPKFFAGKKMEGSIHFYRPSNNKMDFNLDIQTDSSLVQIVSTEKLDKGLWKIKIDLTAGESYYFEKLLMVN